MLKSVSYLAVSKNSDEGKLLFACFLISCAVPYELQTDVKVSKSVKLFKKCMKSYVMAFGKGSKSRRYFGTYAYHAVGIFRASCG